MAPSFSRLFPSRGCETLTFAAGRGNRQIGPRLRAIDPEVEEVGGAGDAGVVIADRLLTAPLQRLVGQMQIARNDVTQIGFDLPLIL